MRPYRRATCDETLATIQLVVRNWSGGWGGATASQWTHNKSCSSNGQNGKSHNIKYITVRAFRAPTNLQILKMQNSNSRNDSK